MVRRGSTVRVEVLGDAIDLEAIDRRLGFLKDNNDNIIELASPLR